MISISFPMYIDPIRTMVNFKNPIYFIQGVFRAEIDQNRLISLRVRLLDSFMAKIRLEFNKFDF